MRTRAGWHPESSHPPSDAIRRPVEIPPGGGMPEHDHGPCQIVLVPLAGPIEVHHDGRTTTLSPGGTAHVGVGAWVRLANPGTEPPSVVVARHGAGDLLPGGTVEVASARRDDPDRTRHRAPGTSSSPGTAPWARPKGPRPWDRARRRRRHPRPQHRGPGHRRGPGRRGRAGREC
ncbi:cupin domain-containing protein [Streptacidiphilus pinicola]|uniref:cupin domain-containing protein n=1 Tax=Streptacidiphilus pinicola TaxID=2219663 RepID=UPI0010583147